MRSLNLDLDAAAQSVVQDIYDCVSIFDGNATILRRTAHKEHGQEVADHLGTLIRAYQVIATTVLNFSVLSPRYGLLEDRQEDGSFLVTF
jgi:hypothetical protein